MKKQFLLLLFLFSSISQATSEISTIEKSFSDTFKIRMGGYLVARNDTVLSATTPYLVGAKINLQDDLGMDAKTNSFRIDSHYRFNDFHKLQFSYYNINNGNNKVIEKSFEFNGSTYEVGSEVNSHLNLNIYKLNYAYSFYHNDKVELAIAAGLHMMGIKTGISGNATKDGSEVHYTDENVRFLAPLPVIGFRLGYAINPRFHVNGAFDYFGISYDDYKGNFTDILITAEYQLYDHWSAGVGFNITALDIKVQDMALYEIEQNVTGFLAYVAYNY
jgi:hypothetical protein